MTTKSEKPSILVVDDEPDNLRDQIALRLNDQATTIVTHPHDIEIADLERADLVLVDYQLDRWSERAAQPVSFRPATGMALAVVLREQVDRAAKDKLTAFALHTGHLDDIRGRLPSETAEHVLARLNNLEWVFTKAEGRRYDQMVLLADAVRQLPRKWPQDSKRSTLEVRRLLAMNEDDKSFERCWGEIRECRAPVHELTTDGHGLLFVRWLLHRILPYPSFLWAEHWVAARLQISVDALHKVIAGNSRLAKELKSMRYSGILAGFLGERWWRGALEDYVWELAGGHGDEEQRLREALTQRAGTKLDSIDPNPAVVCLGGNLKPTGFLSPMTAMTLRPDHWPAFADAAWMAVETVQNDPILLSLVDPLDLHRISGENE